MQRILALSLLLSFSFFSCTSSPKGSELNPQAFKAKINELKNEVVLDVRTPEEYKGGYIGNAVNIDWNNNNFEDEVERLDKATPVFVYCRSGSRSHSAAEAMRNLGFAEVYELDGGIMQWSQAGLPIATPGAAEPTGMTMDQYKELLDQEKLVLVDFHAPWCGPCKQMAPFLKEIATENADLVHLQKIDTDKNPALANALNVSGLPTILLYKSKKIVWSHLGYIGKDELLKIITTFN